MVECTDPSCGKILDDDDMNLSACQDCGGILTPDTVLLLRKQYGQEQVTPVIDAPSIQGPEVPEGGECVNPDCEWPLLGDDWKAYSSGGNCPACNLPKSGGAAPAPQPTPIPDSTTPTPQPTPAPQPQQATSFVTLLVNSGPLAKHGASLNLGVNVIIGRSEIKKQLSDLCTQHQVSMQAYERAISRISREHCRLQFDASTDAFWVEDLGSTNQTFVNREQVIPGSRVAVDEQSMLVLAGELYLIRPGQISVVHRDTGVRLTLVGPQTISPSDVSSITPVHLGRLQTDGSHETFAKAIQRSMEDDPTLDVDEFRRVSRRHAHLSLQSGVFTLTLEQDKKARVLHMATSVTTPELEVTSDAPYTFSFGTCPLQITLGRQVFEVVTG